MKTTITKSEYKELKQLVKEAKILNTKIDKIISRAEEITGEDVDNGFSCDIICNNTKLNDGLELMGIKVEKSKK